MELLSKYNIFLDNHGYQIEPRSYRVSPAPLMGTKFTTGRSAYSDLDFWQIGAVTDFSKGINQKFMIDPSMSFYSEGLYTGKPGEFTLERDTETFSGLPAPVGNITAHYRRLNELYIGDDEGHIMKTSNGNSFTTVYTITATDKKIYNFYEIAGRLFATAGPGNIYCNEAPDSGDTWNDQGVSSQFPLPAYDQTPTDGQSVYGTNEVAQVFRVPMSGDTFHTLKVKIKKTGTPGGDITFTIKSESLTVAGEPGDTITGGTFTIAETSVGTSYAWEEDILSAFDLKAGRDYFLIASASAADSSNYYSWGFETGSKATYDFGNMKTYDGTDWTDEAYKDAYFELRRDNIVDLYYVMVESDYAFGWFGDGIRRSIDGYNWIPEPPDPLWVMPSGEGIPLNAVAIPKSFISGSHRGLWAFVGGSSGINLWDIPDYSNVNNFRGMEKWGHYCIFSIEDQGLYYTDGSQVIPTTMTYLSEGFSFKSCKHIHSNGWDIYALVSDNGTDWYLARTNMSYNSQPKYWWIVKKLDKEPVRIVGWSNEKIFIFYADDSAESFNKINGPYVSSGYVETSYVDENLIKILKMYNNIGMMFSSFPGTGNEADSTYAKLSYSLDNCTGYINSAKTYGDKVKIEKVFDLPNPTIGNRIMIKAEIGTEDTTEAPVVTDLTWKYILQKPSEDVTSTKNWVCTVIAEDIIEDNLGDKNASYDSETPSKRTDILESLWNTAAKKELLNYIGADNKSEIGIEIDYTGSEDSAYITIDRTNYTITYSKIASGDTFTGDANIGGGVNDYSYRDKTLSTVVSELNILWTDMTFTLHQDQEGTRTAHDLEPRLNLLVSKNDNTYLMVGSDVHAVIMGNNSPSQSKLEMDGRGSDRLQIALREA